MWDVTPSIREVTTPIPQGGEDLPPPITDVTPPLKR